MRFELRHPYIQVEDRGLPSYGGSQRKGRYTHMRRWGCGVIAGADLLFYLSRHHAGCKAGIFADAPSSGPVSIDWYNDHIDELRRRFLPVIPYHGINGLALAFGLNCYFRKYDIPLRARWGIRAGKLWNRIDQLLADDIPVIFSIGQSFPRFWSKDKLGFYPAPDREHNQPAARTRAHYVTVTGADEQWLRISSWGKEYYINKTEFCDYVSQHSSTILSSILNLREVE